MASCQSRKIGNCSDYSANKLLQEKAPETFQGSFLIPGSPALCVGRGRVVSSRRNREAPAWHRRGKPFFRLWMRLPGRDGTEDGRAVNGIVYPWRSRKAGVHP